MTLYLLLLFARTAILMVLSFAENYYKRDLPPLQSYPLVSLIVPCYNEEAVVQNAVRSLLRLNYPNFEIIIMDDGSTDKTFEKSKELEKEGRVRAVYQLNAGKAEALNRGISEALGEYVFCVDADSVLHSDVILHGLRYFGKSPKICAVAGNVRVGNRGSWLAAFQKLEYVIGLNFHKPAQSFLSSVTIVPGPVGLFKRAAILEIGGYRSTTFAEDCDLTIRLLMAGHKIVYCPEMIAVTEAPEDITSLLKQRYRWNRGTLQAIKANSYWLLHPWADKRRFFILFYFLLETFIIPSVNCFLLTFLVTRAFQSGSPYLLGTYFIQLTLLDLLITAYSVLFEPQLIGYLILALVNRLTYAMATEVLRLFCIFDELLGLPMSWGKLTRIGALEKV